MQLFPPALGDKPCLQQLHGNMAKEDMIHMFSLNFNNSAHVIAMNKDLRENIHSERFT